MTTHFEAYPLHPMVLQGLVSRGCVTPTPVQAQAMPPILDGRDTLVQASAGSGRTLAYALPLVSLIDPDASPQALVLVASRDRVRRVHDALVPLCREAFLRPGHFADGGQFGPQEEALRRGVDLMIATPERALELIDRGSLDASRLHTLVIEDADELLAECADLLEDLVDALPARKQTVAIASELSAAVKDFARRSLKNAEVVAAAPAARREPQAHYFVRVNHDQLSDSLVAVIQDENPERALVFTRTKHQTRRLAEKIERVTGQAAGYVNGDMSHAARNSMLNRFRDGELKFLVTTEMAARGLEPMGVSHVFHYSLPSDLAPFTHLEASGARSVHLLTSDGEADFQALLGQVTMHELPFDAARLPAREPREAREPAAERQRQPRREAVALEVVIPGLESPREPQLPSTDRGRERGRGRERDRDRNRQQPRREPAHREPSHREPSHREQPRREQGESRRRRGLSPAETNPTRDASALLSHTVRERPSTGPLAPLPRYETTWRKFKLALAPGHRQTRDSLHGWLSQQTGVPRSSLRQVTIFPDHATVEVEGRSTDRFLQNLKGVTAGS